MIEISKKRKIFGNSYKVGTLASFNSDLYEKGLTLLLFIDELQYMYPVSNVEMNEIDLKFKSSFIKDICELAGGGDALVIAAGSSMTLADKALLQTTSDTRIKQYYPSLNNKKMIPITLLPITKKEDFTKGLKILKIETQDINDLYLKTGGIIRMMLSNDRIQLPPDILDKTTLLQVLLYMIPITNKLKKILLKEYIYHKNI